MGYRDDRDALKVRVTSLEEELEEARRTVRRLRGEVAPAISSSVRKGQTVILRELDAQASEVGRQAVAQLARRALGSGDLSLAERELKYLGSGVELRLAPSSSGGTRLTLAFRFAWRALAAVLAVPTTVLASLGTGAIAHGLGAPRWSALVIIFVWACVSGALWARRLRRAFEETTARYRGVLEAAADLVVASRQQQPQEQGTEPHFEAEVQVEVEVDAERLGRRRL